MRIARDWHRDPSWFWTLPDEEQRQVYGLWLLEQGYDPETGRPKAAPKGAPPPRRSR